MSYLWRLSLGLVVICVAGGCVSGPMATGPVNRVTLKHRALDVLRAAVQYEYNPVVRVEAVEALEVGGCEEGLPWIRAALLDEHPAVRFSACVAVGRLNDTVAQRAIHACVDDMDANVQVAALFAQHQFGDDTGTGRMPTYLLQHEDPMVRRNAAMLLGLLGDESAVAPLARAMRDGDEGVRHHALEAMARLGNREARQELTFMANAGVGSDEVFAIDALAQTQDPSYADTFRYKLTSAMHFETRLAAARGLGRLGRDDGYEFALRALGGDRPLIADPNDPAAGQRLRGRQMAAVALGAIGRSEALPALARLMEEGRDPRLQVSGARGVLEVLKADRVRALPFSGDARSGGD